ncbi:excinuclease ABC subunit UvrA [Phycisphaerales bacterium AB-hyl4]|uniref:UvrABC system protein A n=1 Tax=Natronomicrosphaera hydrolytica TaxID=3242702 RepID=A0ABV4U7V4_9BACT
MALTTISIRNAREHNLKGMDIDIPRDKLVVITGLSGSGKSTLAFDTIYAEGQRKYIESLSAYARQFLDQLQKPDVESIEGLPPTIAIEQRSASHNPRSTVATTTEIYDYLRLLFARVGQPRCWHVDEKGKTCGQPIASQSATQIVDQVLSLPEGTKLMVMAPLVRGKKGHHKEVFEAMTRQGFVRARVDGEVMDLREISQSKAGTPFTTKKARYQAHTIEAVIDRIVVREEGPAEGNGEPSGLRSRIADSVELALKLAEGLVLISSQPPSGAGNAKAGSWQDQLFSEKYACPEHPECSLEDLEPRLFSFNSPYGACPSCGGLGTILEFDPELIVANGELSLADGAIEAWRKNGKRMNIYYNRVIRQFCRDFDVSPQTPFKKLGKAVTRILMHGTSPRDEAKYDAHFEGVVPSLQRRFENTDSEFVKARLHNYLSEAPCETCHGARLRTEALHVFIEGDAHGVTPWASKGYYNIHDVTSMTIEQAGAFFDALKLNKEHTTIAAPILKEIRARLGFMLSVGLGYLNLNRATGTLSGGEGQRIRLATQVGSGLVGCCYVLDEPTIGLHQRDNDRLIATLRHLTDIGNTVIVVEHDEDTIRAADHLIDIGPGPGRHGGEVVAQGTLAQVMKHRTSLTAAYLSGRTEIVVPEPRRELNHDNPLSIKGARENNLKNVDIDFPLGGLVLVTGVSGSGKSTLVNQILFRAARRALLASRDKPGAHDKLDGIENIERIIDVDQSPIGRTPRSNPATYTGVFDLIRDLFTKTKESKIRGYKPGRFSFNVKGGRCESCQGQGTKKIEMHFLPDVYVECEVCKGKRYNRETLEITYRGKNISDVLDMTVEDALAFFENFPDVKRLLTALNDVGLSYVQLGQASTTLSGGEAQRVKLATELGKRSTGHTLYILDEPTTGLHFADVEKLLTVLHRLADAGNTIVVIEHNIDVIKCADWVIDLGPEGGDRGGEIVVAGTPEQLADHEASYTGAFLRKYLPQSAKV